MTSASRHAQHVTGLKVLALAASAGAGSLVGDVHADITLANIRRDVATEERTALARLDSVAATGQAYATQFSYTIGNVTVERAGDGFVTRTSQNLGNTTVERTEEAPIAIAVVKEEITQAAERAQPDPEKKPVVELLFAGLGVLAGAAMLKESKRRIPDAMKAGADFIIGVEDMVMEKGKALWTRIQGPTVQ